MGWGLEVTDNFVQEGEVTEKEIKYDKLKYKNN